MGTLRRHDVCILLIIAMCGVKETNTSNIGDTKISGRFDKLQIQNGRFTLRTSYQWHPGDNSVICGSKNLSRVPSDFPHNTMTLNLADNQINILLNTSFEPYPNLVHLDMSDNILRTIESAAFQLFKYLESLDLSRNIHLVLPSSVPFQPLVALVLLSLQECNLENLPTDLMENFPHLKYLDLGFNRLSSLNVSRCNTDGLNEVDLGANLFHDLTPDRFIFVCTTVKFNLIENPIRHISEEVIASLHVDELGLGGFAANASMIFNLTIGVARSRIALLVLMSMELRDVFPNHVFKPLYDHPFRLVIAHSGHLKLDNNVLMGLNCNSLTFVDDNIYEIEPQYFREMSCLQELSLIDSQIMHFNRYNTTWENNLEYLDLSGNELTILYSDQFRGLSNLKFLNLSRNKALLALDLLPFNGFESLELLNVSETAITRLGLSSGLSKCYFADLKEFNFIPGKTFSNTVKLELIDVSNSELKGRNVWDSEHRRSLFGGLVKLWELHLSNNHLGTLPDRVFEDNSLLTNLMIDNCEISSLTGNVFQGLHSLVYIDLNGNNLLLISTNALKNLPGLQTLSMSDNIIMFVEDGAMENVPLLKNLRMSNNRLAAFNLSTWFTLMNYDMNSIDISGNPLACQCNFAWLYDLVNLSGMFLHQNETLCSFDSLSQLRGKPLFEFDPSKYCVPNIVLLSTLPFVGLALFIGLLLAFYNRWLIRYKLFLLKLAIIGYRELQDTRGHSEFVFDLNIMFTEEDEVWAREHLRPTLEERLPDYDRFSFGDEDLTLGMHYLDAVHYAVDHSFKTILLLSRRAVQDNWFLIKFRIAMDHVHDELTENTVVIFLEDIPEDEIPYLVRLYLSDRRPYMRWPEDARGHEYFWHELMKVVTVNLRYNPLVPPE